MRNESINCDWLCRIEDSCGIPLGLGAFHKLIWRIVWLTLLCSERWPRAVLLLKEDYQWSTDRRKMASWVICRNVLSICWGWDLNLLTGSYNPRCEDVRKLITAVHKMPSVHQKIADVILSVYCKRSLTFLVHQSYFIHLKSTWAIRRRSTNLSAWHLSSGLTAKRHMLYFPCKNFWNIDIAFNERVLIAPLAASMQTIPQTR